LDAFQKGCVIVVSIHRIGQSSAITDRVAAFALKDGHHSPVLQKDSTQTAM